MTNDQISILYVIIKLKPNQIKKKIKLKHSLLFSVQLKTKNETKVLSLFNCLLNTNYAANDLYIN